MSQAATVPATCSDRLATAREGGASKVAGIGAAGEGAPGDPSEAAATTAASGATPNPAQGDAASASIATARASPAGAVGGRRHLGEPCVCRPDLGTFS